MSVPQSAVDTMIVVNMFSDYTNTKQAIKNLANRLQEIAKQLPTQTQYSVVIPSASQTELTTIANCATVKDILINIS